MNWYYAEGGQQAGPVSEEELLRLAESGRVQSDTLVWNEGLANWQPYSYVKPRPVVLPPVQVADNEAVCVECGKVVLRDNAVSYGGSWVCAACKPVYFQKLKEGAALPVLPLELPYAGFWIRFAAKFIDSMALG